MRAGESFFVPALDLQATMKEGMRAAEAYFGCVPKARAQPAVFKGMLGVMFKLRYLPPQRDVSGLATSARETQLNQQPRQA